MRRLRLLVALSLSGAALASIPFAANQQPTGEPFTTAIRKVKVGLYVIPGYDGAVTGGNVAVRVTNEGVVIVDDRFPPSSGEIVGKVRSVTSQPAVINPATMASRSRSELSRQSRATFTRRPFSRPMKVPIALPSPSIPSLVSS